MKSESLQVVEKGHCDDQIKCCTSRFFQIPGDFFKWSHPEKFLVWKWSPPTEKITVHWSHPRHKRWQSFPVVKNSVICFLLLKNSVIFFLLLKTLSSSVSWVGPVYLVIFSVGGDQFLKWDQSVLSHFILLSGTTSILRTFLGGTIWKNHPVEYH